MNISTDRKRYEALIWFDPFPDTYDADGDVQPTGLAVDITEDRLLEAMEKFVGEIEQIPPSYSALKINGRKAYELARKGEPVEILSRKSHWYASLI